MSKTTEETTHETTTRDQWPDPADLHVLRNGLPAEDVDRRIGLAHALAGIRHRVLSFYLHETHSRGLHQLFGFRSCAQYAASRFGMSRREARDLLAAGKALLELPQIDQAFAGGELSWTKVRQLIKVAVAEHEVGWLERAKAINADELALEVRLARHGDPPRNWDDRKGLPEIRMKLEAMMPPDVYAKWECVRRRVQDDTPHPVHVWECLDAAFDALLQRLDEMDAGRAAPPSRPRYCVVMRHGAPDGPVAVETEDGPVPVDPIGAETCACGADHVDPGRPDPKADRRIPEWIKRKVLARDRCRCRGCNCRLRLDHHHILKWSEGGPTEIGNLLILCRKCHALVHADLLVIKEDAQRGWMLLDRQGRDIHGPEVQLKELLAELDQEVMRLRLPEPTAPGGSEPGTACQPAPPHGRPTLRPKRFGDLVDQGGVVTALEQAVDVARHTGEPMGHTVLLGGAGLGKTSIAGVVAAELGVGLTATSGPHLTEIGQLVRLLRGLGDREVLFIDEIHALPQPLTLVLYEAMEDFRVSLPRTRDAESGTACHLRPFALIGATTEPGLLPGPLLSRFENRHWIDFYQPCALAAVIERCASRFGIEIEGDAAARLASVSRGTPREAVRLLRKARQLARAEGAASINGAVAARTLLRLGIDQRGLQPLDRAYLKTVADHGPIGLTRAAAMLGVDTRVLQRDHEPYLFRLGLATATPQGRIALNGMAGSRSFSICPENAGKAAAGRRRTA